MHRRLLALAVVLASAGCDHTPPILTDLGAVLVRGTGKTDLDASIGKAQDEIRTAPTALAVPERLEKLGRLFVAKARTTQDPGYYKLAELCADGIAARQPEHAGGRLLRGHVLHSLHRFAAAETVARALVAERGTFADRGLLGDVLYDRGQPEAALVEYQAMLDLRPCLQSYTRAGQVRWLRGDLDGARQLLRLAVGAGSQRDPEALCWAHARLAMLELQAGDTTAALETCARGQRVDQDSVGLLLAQARILAAGDNIVGALGVARRAAELCPLPEHRWLAADLARQAGQLAVADELEAGVHRTGALDDPRHFALFLLSRGTDAAKALALAEQELRERQDVFTHDLHAWALFANERLEAAEAAIELATALDTGDARIAYHAGAIAMARGDRTKARDHFTLAQHRAATLWPSEREDLARRMAAL